MAWPGLTRFTGRENMEFAGLPWFVWAAVFVALFSGLCSFHRPSAQEEPLGWRKIAGSVLIGIVVFLAIFAVIKVF